MSCCNAGVGDDYGDWPQFSMSAKQLPPQPARPPPRCSDDSGVPRKSNCSPGCCWDAIDYDNEHYWRHLHNYGAGWPLLHLQSGDI